MTFQGLHSFGSLARVPFAFVVKMVFLLALKNNSFCFEFLWEKIIIEKENIKKHIQSK